MGYRIIKTDGGYRIILDGVEIDGPFDDYDEAYEMAFQKYGVEID